MIKTKEDFLKSFLPDKITELDYVQINLDITDLSIPDILRNLNKTYPINSRARNAIASGTMAIAVLCKTETIAPLKGMFILLTNDDLEFQVYSSNYVVLAISENNIKTDNGITDTIDKITSYLANNFDDQLYNLAHFYRKFVYDPHEMEDDYIPEDGFYL